MNILIDSCSYNCQNVGDLSMLQVAVARLRALHPKASIDIITNAPEIVRRHCSDISTVPAHGRRLLLEDRLLGRMGDHLPVNVARRWSAREASLRIRRPELFEAALRFKQRLGRVDATGSSEFLAAIKRADLVVVSGAGIFTDAFRDNVVGILATLDLAIRRNVPTAILGHGFGPIDDPSLRARAAAILPFVSLITIRERLASLPFLLDLGVPRSRIVVTGDDAIELAYGSREHSPGTDSPARGIGVNLRIATYAAVGREALEVVRRQVHAAASRYGAPLVAVPIAHHGGGMDLDTLRDLLGDFENAGGMRIEFDRPEEVISQVARCRVVVTGSYHGAVFALAQGIPAVAIVKSPYYRHKMTGLADQFGIGCEVIAMDAPDFENALSQAIERAWESADVVRPALLEAARRQTASARQAYQRVSRLITGSAAVARAATVEAFGKDEAAHTQSAQA